MDGMETVFPLYLYETSEANLIQVKGKLERRPNFDAAIYAKICAAVNDAPCLQSSANTARNDDRLAYYRSHELGKTWYDVADPRELLSMEPIRIDQLDEKTDRQTVKDIFRAMKPVQNILDGRTVSFPVKAAKKIVYHQEINIFGLATRFQMLFAESKWLWSERAADIPNHLEHRNIDAYHQYGVLIKLQDVTYCVRFTVREDRKGASRNELHGQTVSRIRIYKATGTELSLRSHIHAEGSVPFVDYKIALFLSAVNGGAKSFQPTPEDVFNYIYGVLHTPSYREKYREFLKIDFPRIPYPQGAAEFRRVAAIGAKLVKVHLLKDEMVTNPFSNPYAKFSGAGDGKVTEVKVEGEGEQRKVRINKSQWFEPVPEEAWNFYIGGYQPAQKWLKDRKGRTLTTDDQQHYRAIVAALVKTSALMGELESGMRN